MCLKVVLFCCDLCPFVQVKTLFATIVTEIVKIFCTVFKCCLARLFVVLLYRLYTLCLIFVRVVLLGVGILLCCFLGVGILLCCTLGVVFLELYSWSCLLTIQTVYSLFNLCSLLYSLYTFVLFSWELLTCRAYVFRCYNTWGILCVLC